MTTIYCGAIDCKHNKTRDDGACLCSADHISLTDSYYNTVYEGYKHFNICEKYEKSKEAIRIEKMFKEIMKI